MSIKLFYSLHDVGEVEPPAGGLTRTHPKVTPELTVFNQCRKGARKALDLIRKADDRREAVLRDSERMKNGLQEIGFDTGTSTSQIIPIHIGDDMKCLKFWRALFDDGVFTNAFITPGVPPGGALLRTSYMPTHTDEMLDESPEIFERVGRKMKII